MTDQPPTQPPYPPSQFPPPGQPPYPPAQFAPPAPQPAPKKRKKWPFVVGGIVVLIVIISAANGGGNTPTQQPTGAPAGNETTQQPSGAPAGNEASATAAAQQPAQPSQPAQPAQHTVVYSVTGSGKASDITYITDGMTSMNQETDVKLPWKKTLTLPTGQAFQMVSLSAQGSTSSSKVDVTITVDGQVVKQASATGYGVASASGDIGN